MWVLQLNPAMRDMVKSVFPEAVARRTAEKSKAAATKDFQALVFSNTQKVEPAVIQVRVLIA